MAKFNLSKHQVILFTIFWLSFIFCTICAAGAILNIYTQLCLALDCIFGVVDISMIRKYNLF